MNKQGAYLPLPPPLSLISSAWTWSGNTNHTCSPADSLSLPHSLSSLGMAQVESMLTSCAADHGHHAMHACQWPTPPHRLAMSVAAPLLRAVVWKEGCPPTACVRVCATPCCIPHSAFSAHICVLIVLEAHGCPLSLSSSSSSSTTTIMWRRGRARRKEAEQPCRAAMQSGAEQASEMTITNRAVRWHTMCCWMRMQSTRSTTLVQHVSHLYSSTAFPFPLSLTMRHTATPQRRR